MTEISQTTEELTPNEFVDFWQGRYESASMPWDLGAAHPYFEQVVKETPVGAMVSLGSGRGHDAACFARAGFTVTGLDYAPGAIAAARELYGDVNGQATWLQADIFNLPDNVVGAFDYVLEHTCFCAINPKRRDDYVQSVSTLLKPGGQLMGIFWDLNDPDGPPFGVTPDKLPTYFEPDFTQQSMMQLPADFQIRGDGAEFFARFHKKA